MKAHRTSLKTFPPGSQWTKVAEGSPFLKCVVSIWALPKFWFSLSQKIMITRLCIAFEDFHPVINTATTIILVINITTTMILVIKIITSSPPLFPRWQSQTRGCVPPAATLARFSSEIIIRSSASNAMNYTVISIIFVRYVVTRCWFPEV